MSSFIKQLRSVLSTKDFLSSFRRDFTIKDLQDTINEDPFFDRFITERSLTGKIIKIRSQSDFVDVKDALNTERRTISGLSNPQIILEPDKSLLTLWLKFDWSGIPFADPYGPSSAFQNRQDASCFENGGTNMGGSHLDPDCVDYYLTSNLTISDLSTFPGKTGNTFDWVGSSAQGFNTPFANTNSSAFDYLAVNTNANIALDFTTGFTYSFWINPTDLTALAADRIIFQKWTDANNWCQLAIKSTGELDWHVNEAGVTVKRKSSSNLSVNTWYHVVCVYNAATNVSELYLNNVAGSAGSATVTAPAASTTLFIGAASSTGYYSGYMDDFRYYKAKVLSSTEVSDLYNFGTITHSITYPAIIGTSYISS